MKESNARVRIEINVECPHCENEIDLLSLTSMTDDGMIYSAALGDGSWGCEDFNEKLTCPECYERFNIKSIEY